MPNLVYMPGHDSQGEQTEALAPDPGKELTQDPEDRFGQPHRSAALEAGESPRFSGLIYAEAGPAPPCLGVGFQICRGCPGWEAMARAAGPHGPWRGVLIHCPCSGRTARSQERAPSQSRTPAENNPAGQHSQA